MRYIYIGLLSVLLASCSGSKMLQSSLSKYSSSIAYLHDKPQLTCPSTDSVALIINNSPLDSAITVSKMRGLVLPFIFFNYFESNMKVKLGQNSLGESYTDFFQSAFEEENKRTGCFGMSPKVANDSTYTLELNFDTCTTYSKYSKRSMFMFLVFAYSWSISESGSPAETNLQVSAKLKKAGNLIFEKTYPIKRTQPFVQSNTQHLGSDFVSNMVESLSLSTKQCIEEIISDINTSFQRKGEPVTASHNAVSDQP